MAHFAKIDDNNKVIKIETINNDIESNAVEFLKNLYNEPTAKWIKCSYNTRGGKYYYPNTFVSEENLHPDQSKAFRKNYPGLDWTYDESKDAFIPPMPTEPGTWELNNETCLWVDTSITLPEGYEPDVNKR
jgi:hypothetical protein